MRYRLYIDETGTDDLTHVHLPEQRHLCLTGIIMHLDHVENFATPAMNRLKQEFFSQSNTGRWKDPDDTHQYIVFHRGDMVRKKGPFGVLNQENVRTAFDLSLLAYLQDTNFVVLSVVLDKTAMLRKLFWREKNPYHYLLQIMVEKYALWLRRKGAVGDVMAEKRHGRKDIALAEAFTNVIEQGTYYAHAELIKSRLAAHTLKLRSKQENVTGLQIADLLAQPCCQLVCYWREGRKR